MFENSLAYIQEKLHGFVPDTAVILGSGLGDLAHIIESPIIIPYSDIPNFPRTTVAGHLGRLFFGKIGKHNVVCMQGRFHIYEGIDPFLIFKVMQLLKSLGVQNLIITNAAGSLNPDIPVGAIMMIKDHINMSGENPLISPDLETSFPDLSNAYDKNLRTRIKQIALENKIVLYEGVYIMVTGPNFETAAEIRMFQSFGADAIGMSTVPEVISAVHQGMNVVAFSIISNMGTGMSSDDIDHKNVLEVVQASCQSLQVIIRKFLDQEF